MIPARRRSRCAWEGTVAGIAIEPFAFFSVQSRLDKLNTSQRTAAGRHAATKECSKVVLIAEPRASCPVILRYLSCLIRRYCHDIIVSEDTHDAWRMEMFMQVPRALLEGQLTSLIERRPAPFT